jgi:hypothetical protein
MEIKNIFATSIGIIQTLIGLAGIILAFLIYYNPNYFPFITIFNLQQEYIPFYILILFIIGLFAVLSGLLIIHEWLSRY